MKKIFYISVLLLTLNTFGQIKSENVKGLKITKQETVSENDTIITVNYLNKIESNRKPAYFINGELTNESVLKTLNPNEIATINVEKGDIEIENVNYNGKLYIVTKLTYKPILISLNNLKMKYTSIKENSTIFKIDNEIINADYDNYVIDENYILKINVEKFENSEEKLKFNIVNLITKTEENIKKSKEIIIRGKDEFAINK